MYKTSECFTLQLDAPKPVRKETVPSSGNCVPDAFYWTVTEVANWIEDIGLWQYKVLWLVVEDPVFKESNRPLIYKIYIITYFENTLS